MYSNLVKMKKADFFKGILFKYCWQEYFRNTSEGGLRKSRKKIKHK
jgi:hypothetical protein